MRNAFVQPGKTEEEERFGIIIGPTGTGKTSIIRNLCNEEPTSSRSRWAVEIADTFKYL